MALLMFLCLAGVQPSVMRAVMALLISESGHHSRPVGVLLLTLSGMLLLRPAWALSIGFQLSAAATAGLILTASRLEQAVQAWLPDCCQGLAAALSIPVAALLWTLPLQLLHFGAMPLYALLANLLVAPLLALGLLPWLLGAAPCRRRWSLIPMATALLVRGLVQLGDGLVAVEWFGHHWLLAPQQGRSPIAIGHVLQSTGLAMQCLHQRSGAMVLRVGSQRWQLFPRPQALWPLQEQQRSEYQPAITGKRLGFKPSASQRRWLLQHGVGARFIGL